MDPFQIIDYQNRRLRRPLEFDFIERRAMDELMAQVGRSEITVLLGARQTGKTTLLRRLIHLVESRSTAGRVLYMNMDSAELRRTLASATELASMLEARGLGTGDMVAIDEVQRIDEPGMYLKQLHDLGTGFKIVVSGSSSLEIGSQTREHLTGRRRVVTLWPLTFEELATHEHLVLPRHDDGHAGVDGAMHEALSGLLARIAVYGGYPALWHERDPVEKAGVLASIFETYVRRDVVEFLRVRNASGFNDLVRVLAGQVGGLVNYSALSSLAGVDVKTVRSYLEILEQTYVIRIQRPHATNPRKEIRKSPKCPFVDNGLLGAAAGDFSPLGRRSDPGPLLENLVVSEIVKTTGARVRYWRTTSGAEVDVIVQHPDRLVPVEIKASRLRRPSPGRGFRSFLARYEPERAFVLHRGARFQERTGKTVVDFLPIHEGLLLRPWD